MGDILRITDPILSDDSIDKYEHSSMSQSRGPTSTILEEILRYTSKLKIFLRIPAKFFYL